MEKALVIDKYSIIIHDKLFDILSTVALGMYCRGSQIFVDNFFDFEEIMYHSKNDEEDRKESKEALKELVEKGFAEYNEGKWKFVNRFIV